MRFLDPHVERHLISDQGEVIIDEVVKHWTAAVRPTLEVIASLPLFALSVWVSSWQWSWLSWVPWIGAALLLVHGLWRLLDVRLDRFVITNMRVFRVHGILSRHIATMPISRILDISVRKPLIGRVFGYGHFIFESAAQDQGLKEIRYVGDPDERGLTIQRVIQRSGLRGPVGRAEEWVPQPEPARETGRRRPRWPGRTADPADTQPIEGLPLDAKNSWPYTLD